MNSNTNQDTWLTCSYIDTETNQHCEYIRKVSSINEIIIASSNSALRPTDVKFQKDVTLTIDGNNIQGVITGTSDAEVNTRFSVMRNLILNPSEQRVIKLDTFLSNITFY